MTKEPYGWKIVLVDQYMDASDHMHFHRGDRTIYSLETALERIPLIKKEVLSPDTIICLVPIIPDVNEV